MALRAKNTLTNLSFGRHESDDWIALNRDWYSEVQSIIRKDPEGFFSSEFLEPITRRDMALLESYDHADSPVGRSFENLAHRFRSDSELFTRPSAEIPKFTAFDGKPRDVLTAHQEWEGVVTKVCSESFEAMLRDKTAGDQESKEVAEFDIGLMVSADDLELLKEGAIFNWVIGTEVKKEGTKRKVSFIKFRRLPAFTAADFAQARSFANEMMELFPTDESDKVTG